MVSLDDQKLCFICSGDPLTLHHSHFMRLALAQAQLAADLDEIPVGAVLVRDDEVIAAAHNQPIHQCDPTAHAEVQVLRQAAQKLGNYRLVGCRLYVTLEPCTMCVGAMVHGRIDHLIFGATEPKAGAVISQSRLLDATYLNHRVSYIGGVLGEACGELLSDFFKARR